MSLSNAPQAVRMQSISRKPIARKPLNGLANPSAQSLGNGASSTPMPQANVGHLSQSGPATATASDSEKNIAGVAGQQSAYGSTATLVPSPLVSTEQTNDKRLSQAPALVRPPFPVHMNHVRSFDSVLSESSDASGRSASQSTVASSQSGVTTPMTPMTPMSSFSTVFGQTTSANGLPVLTRSMSEPSTLPTTLSRVCHNCRTEIQANASTFDCLICSTGGVNTKFCVYCFTTGAAATGHSQHDQSYYVTESDRAVRLDPKLQQGPVYQSVIPPELWTVRKNAAGRIWYQHRASGFRTHVRPFTALVPAVDLPVGWEVRLNPDGKKYYFNAVTGASVWSPPAMTNPLASGWRQIRTPDGVPFFVCDSLQLASWERPGDAPKAPTGKSAGKPAAASNTKDVAEKVEKGKSGKSKGKSNVVHGVAAAGAAVTVASSIAQLADAADLSPQGILSATVAAARLTSHGAKFAGKKMKLGKLMKNSKLRRASTMFTQVSNLAGDDGDNGDFGAECDSGDEEEGVNVCVVEETEECEAAYVTVDTSGYQEQQMQEYEPQPESYSPPVDTTYVQEPYMEETYPPVQETMQPPFDDPYQAPSTEPPVIVNNVYVEENNVYNEVVVEQTNVEETTVYNEVAVEQTTNIEVVEQTNVEVNEYTQENVQITENVNEFTAVEPIDAQPPFDIPPAEYRAPFGSGLPPAGIPEYTLPPPSDINVPMLEPPPNSLPSDAPIEPFVFNPVLAGPMMVNPPAEQNGVIFAPTYV
jgi:hypothetical protein